MKRFIVIGAVALALLWCCAMAFAQTAPPAGRGAAAQPLSAPAPVRAPHIWWRDQGPGAGRGRGCMRSVPG